MVDLKPQGNYVLLKFIKVPEKERTSKGGIIMPDIEDNTQPNKSNSKYTAVLIDIGEECEKNWEKGVSVIPNEFDIKKFEDTDAKEETIYGLCKEENIMATYRHDEEDEKIIQEAIK